MVSGETLLFRLQSPSGYHVRTPANPWDSFLDLVCHEVSLRFNAALRMPYRGWSFRLDFFDVDGIHLIPSSASNDRGSGTEMPRFSKEPLKNRHFGEPDSC